MINLDGATLLFPTSFGYFNPHMLKMAQKYSEAALPALRRTVDARQASEERRQLFRLHRRGAVHQRHRRRLQSKTGKLGFIAAKPIPQVLRNINAFTMGAKLVNPKVTTQVIFTGDWSMPVKEAEAANSLIDQGIDVVTCHVDGPKIVVENAARRGAMVCGYHVNQARARPARAISPAPSGTGRCSIRRFVEDVHRRRDHSRISSAAA